MSQFAILIFERELPGGMADMPPEVLEAHGQVEGKVKASGGSIVHAHATQPSNTAKAVRGPDVTDGPFAAGEQTLSGFFVVEARDIDHAVEIAGFVPIMDGGVEVRPLLG
jgi:hypothetical protein